MLESKHTDSASTKHEELTILWWQPQPHCGQNAQHMTVGKERDIAVHFGAALNNTLYSCSNMLHEFALHNAVPPQRPGRIIFANVCRAAAFVDAVVPFFEIVRHFGYIAVSCDPAGLSRTLHRTYEDQCELASSKLCGKFLGLLDSTGQQWKIGA